MLSLAQSGRSGLDCEKSNRADEISTLFQEKSPACTADGIMGWCRREEGELSKRELIKRME